MLRGGSSIGSSKPQFVDGKRENRELRAKNAKLEA